ncbi:hypothetical protein BAMA_09780 [Bacillus manliponensis]|uniref:Uncharacterized protein n=1 Tax=Bacillus manliponensis TaxID=574376 RepID=A0A073K3L3_9BACI|nr:hypothetical protein BAMA_09780 [Bacillus manliponensis]
MCSSGQGLFLARVKLQQMDEVSTFAISIPLFAGCKSPICSTNTQWGVKKTPTELSFTLYTWQLLWW